MLKWAATWLLGVPVPGNARDHVGNIRGRFLVLGEGLGSKRPLTLRLCDLVSILPRLLSSVRDFRFVLYFTSTVTLTTVIISATEIL